MLNRRTLAALLAAALSTSASALDTFGPPFGANKYATSIRGADGIPDQDDYVGSLLAGEKLTVAVAAAKGSALLPAVTLVDPAGVESSPPVVEKSGGRSVTLSGFVVPKTGRWGVRVAGKDGSEGAYTVAFSIKPAPKPPVLKQHLGGTDPLVAEFSVDALDGALLDVAVKWPKKEPVVHIGTLRDPSGALASTPPASQKPGSASLSHVAMHKGDGAYKLQIYIDSGAADASVSLRVTPQGRPKSAKTVVLSAAEPALAPADAPIEGVSGGRVHLTGSGLPTTAAPAVYFGLLAGTDVSVAPDGRSLDVTAPGGHDDATVSVAVVAADGQGTARADYFHFVPAPVITDLTGANGTPRHGGSTLGGSSLRLVGRNFRKGSIVRVDTRPAVVSPITDATRVDLVTPIGAVGLVPLTLQDEFGRVVEAPFLFEYKAPATFSTTPFAYVPAFGAAGGGTAVTITGTNFDPTDQLVIGGVNVPSTYVSASKRTFTSPNVPEGTYTLAIVDRFGTSASGPAFEVLSAPVVSTVAAVAGARIGTGNIAMGGGTSVQVTGSNLRSSDTVTLGGATGTVTSVTNTTLVFTAPPGSPGNATLTISDPVGQSVSLANAIRYVGFVDTTTSRTPGASATDDLTARRGAMGDLDGDGKADDLAIVSDDSSPGTRDVLTRMFFGISSQLTDETATKFPAKGADPFGSDDFHAAAIAIGDLDTASGKDMVIAGAPSGTTYTYYYYNYYTGGYYTTTTSYYTYDARVFSNNGSGTFTFSTLSPPVRTSSVTCTNGSGSTFSVFTPLSGASGVLGAKATALAVGDIDGNGTGDIVMATDHFRAGTVQIPPNFVTFNAGTPGSYVDSQAASHYTYYGTTYYAPALRIFQNRGAAGFEDATFPRIPLAGTSGSIQPAFHGRDVKLGDIDHDAAHSLDIVVTWDDPLTTTPAGLTSPGSDSARVATKILINNGSGFFTDATSHWMPAGSAPEFWQGSRVELVDLDNDGDLDLVILHAQSVDAYLGAPTFTKSALRILRNDGAAVGFTDVTATALPSVPLAGTSNDNLRGTALVVRDVDGDGFKDILVGTTEALLTPSGTAARRTRFLRGGTGLVFTDASDFLPVASAESGEADDLVVGDIAGNPDPSLVLLTETPPAASVRSEAMRVFDWKR